MRRRVTSGVEVCLVVKSEREVADAYTDFGFAKRTGSTGSFSYTPTSYAVKNTGTHCAPVTEWRTQSRQAVHRRRSTSDRASVRPQALAVARGKVEQVKTAAAETPRFLRRLIAPTNVRRRPSTLASGSRCQRDAIIAVSGPSRCNAAKLTAATCRRRAALSSAHERCRRDVHERARARWFMSTDEPDTRTGTSACTLGVLDAATCVQDSKFETSVTFSGISEDITDEIEAKLLEAMKTAVRNNGDFAVNVSAVQLAYVVSGSMSFASAPTTSAFKTDAATALGVDASAITNVQGTSSARRRLLAASVTYDVSSTTRAAANTLRSMASADFAVGGVLGTSSPATASVKVDATISIPDDGDGDAQRRSRVLDERRGRGVDGDRNHQYHRPHRRRQRRRGVVRRVDRARKRRRR